MSEQFRWRAERQNLSNMIAEQDGRILIAIGVSNGAEARQLYHTVYELYDRNAIPDYIGGFVTFVSGYLCAANYGLPDMGYILRPEIANQTNIIEQSTCLAALNTGKPAFPIGVDIDTGYGNEPSSVLLTCYQIHKQGAQYVQIEDQYNINKTCGHMVGANGKGKQVVTAEEMVSMRLKPAVSYAENQDDFLVMARTDAIAPLGFNEAIRRGHIYAEAGAKMIFIEALENEEQMVTAAQEFNNSSAMIIANMIEGSPKTPYMTPYELHKMGFGLALYCIGSLLSSRIALQKYYATIAQGGSVLAGKENEMDQWFNRFNTVIGRDQVESINNFFYGER